MNPPFLCRKRRGLTSEQVAARSLAVSLGCSLAVVSFTQGPPAEAQLTGQDDKDEQEEELQLQPIFVHGETPSGPVNPYANPEAPYKIDYSASPKLTEPLLNTPRTVQAIPKELIDATGATSLKDVMRLQPGITLGTGEGGNGFGIGSFGTYLPKCRNAGKPFQYWLFSKNLHESTEVKLLSPPNYFAV